MLREVIPDSRKVRRLAPSSQLGWFVLLCTYGLLWPATAKASPGLTGDSPGSQAGPKGFVAEVDLGIGVLKADDLGTGNAFRVTAVAGWSLADRTAVVLAVTGLTREDGSFNSSLWTVGALHILSDHLALRAGLGRSYLTQEPAEDPTLIAAGWGTSAALAYCISSCSGMAGYVVVTADASLGTTRGRNDSLSITAGIGVAWW